MALFEWCSLLDAIDYIADNLDERWTRDDVLDAGERNDFLVRSSLVRSNSKISSSYYWSHKVEVEKLKKYVSKRLAKEKTPLPTSIKINKLRRNILDPAIDKAINLASNTQLADVYLQLRELAIQEEKPFTGVVDGDALCYTNDSGQSARLTKDALGKRLKSRAQ